MTWGKRLLTMAVVVVAGRGAVFLVARGMDHPPAWALFGALPSTEERRPVREPLPRSVLTGKLKEVARAARERHADGVALGLWDAESALLLGDCLATRHAFDRALANLGDAGDPALAADLDLLARSVDQTCPP